MSRFSCESFALGYFVRKAKSELRAVEHVMLGPLEFASDEERRVYEEGVRKDIAEIRRSARESIILEPYSDVVSEELAAAYRAFLEHDTDSDDGEEWPDGGVWGVFR